MCRHIIVSVDWIVLNLARMMMNVRRDHMHGALRVLVLVRREMWR